MPSTCIAKLKSISILEAKNSHFAFIGCTKLRADSMVLLQRENSIVNELSIISLKDRGYRCTVPLLFAAAPQNVRKLIRGVRLKIPFLQGSNQRTERNNRGNTQILSTRIQSIACFNYAPDQISELKYQHSRC